MSLWLKLAALLAIALAFTNAQCLAQCSLSHCQSQVDQAGGPPCHQRHHNQVIYSCAQLASLDYAAPVAHAPAFVIGGLLPSAIPLSARRRVATCDIHSPPRLAQHSTIPLRI